MRSRRPLLLATAMLALPHLAPANADTLTWTASVEGRAGYQTNPFLNFGRGNTGAGVLGVTVAPALTWRNPTAQTDLTGSFNYDQYTSHFGHSDDYTIDLRRRQTLSTRLTLTGEVGYYSIFSGLNGTYYNALVIDPGAVDQLAVGIRQKRVFGNLGFTWQPTSRDTYSLTGLAEHDDFSRFGQNYTYYGANGSYLRQIDGRTQVGLQLGLSRYLSNEAPSSESASPNLVVNRVLSARWTLSASVGAIIEHERFRGSSETTVTPGFSLKACDKSTRLDLCLAASRVATSSGIGGLRRQTQVSGDLTYRLAEHSRVLAVASYGISNQDDRLQAGFFGIGTLHYALARVDYQRDLGRRLTAGVSGIFQNRTGGDIPNAHSFGANVNLTAHFGHYPT